jgi:hypothetical protein
VAVQEAFVVAGEPGLVAGQDPEEGQVRGGGAEPGRAGRGVRGDVGHASVGEGLDDSGATEFGRGGVLSAAAG